MKSCKFTLCCGANIIYDFGGTDNTEGDMNDEDNESIREWFKNHRYALKKGFSFIILNNEQYEQYHDVLVEHGFELVRAGKNPNHDTTMYAYIRTRRPVDF